LSAFMKIFRRGRPCDRAYRLKVFILCFWATVVNPRELGTKREAEFDQEIAFRSAGNRSYSRDSTISWRCLTSVESSV